ncbi:hypothetical protein FACS1894151_09490 [Spirochaetia bacterium]|nr:hypothetical protein FACS1894151_09490 [Spirochaetia bacterium]
MVVRNRRHFRRRLWACCGLADRFYRSCPDRSDLTWGGIWWSWVIADAVYGFLVGLLWKFYKIEEGGFRLKTAIIFNAAQIAANFIAWLAIAPTLDILIYQEPANKVFIQGLVAAGLNSAVVLILGTLVALGYSRSRVKAGSLKEE